MIEIKSPAEDPTKSRPHYSIFLAGSIEQDTADDWQDKVVSAFVRDPVVIYNPRRADWDASLTNEITEPVFEHQVMWELKYMNLADTIVMYFQPGTKSPITLLELGLHADSNKLVVCCPPGFWRRGNVDIICREYKIEEVESIDGLVEVVRRRMAAIDQVRADMMRYMSDLSPLTNILKRIEKEMRKELDK